MEQGESIESEGSQEETDGSAQSVEERLEKKLADVTPQAEGAAAEPQAASEPATGGRGDVSAATLARMMGLATATEVGLLEGKIDLLSSRINSITLRMEKVLNTLGKMPQTADMDRIDVNIGSLKTMIRDTLEKTTKLAEMDNNGETSLNNVQIMTSESEDESGEAE